MRGSGPFVLASAVSTCPLLKERQDAMYKMFGAEYEASVRYCFGAMTHCRALFTSQRGSWQAPKSDLYAELEGEQVPRTWQ